MSGIESGVSLPGAEGPSKAGLNGPLRRRLGGSDGRSHRAELLGLAARVLERRARVRVHEVALLYVDVATLDQQARVLSLQESSCNSPGPEVDPLPRVLGDLRMDDHVRDLEPPAGAQHAIDLAEHRGLV